MDQRDDRDNRSPGKLKRIIFLGFLSAVLPFSITGETLLTEPEALKIVFAKSQSVEPQVRALSESQRQTLQKKTGLRFPESEYRFFIGHGNAAVEGYAVIMNEIGKHEYITFIVGISPKGKIRDVAVMDYRETRRFLRQFRGKNLADPITVDRDIVNYTGATLSSHAIARGVKKALALVQAFYLQPDPDNRP